MIACTIYEPYSMVRTYWLEGIRQCIESEVTRLLAEQPMRLYSVIAYPDGEVDGIDPVWRIDALYHVLALPMAQSVNVSVCQIEIINRSYIDKVLTATKELLFVILATNKIGQTTL